MKIKPYFLLAISLVFSGKVLFAQTKILQFNFPSPDNYLKSYVTPDSSKKQYVITLVDADSVHHVLIKQDSIVINLSHSRSDSTILGSDPASRIYHSKYLGSILNGTILEEYFLKNNEELIALST